ncbi:hypothetical protein [Mucilaginibacter rubeus]|uniref:Uncharacterized protein n=1 Tax=Mucilaginibacter rubeus TaxID=2027860 RepID=A0A5C1HYI3_9SPHI|nr:hypothetical protein [Mucilaginibacter rubeus]QEM10071.1 hypothetical protein DEO27_008550 [Mucilaginibacter rubeus]
MITRFAPGLFLREESEGVLVVTYEDPVSSFEKTIHLNSTAIIYNDRQKSKAVVIDKNSLVLITINQGSRGTNTCAEIYIKNQDDMVLLATFSIVEAVNDLRKTRCYKLVEYIANRLKVKYGIEWEYKISVDTPEKEKEFNKNVFIVILTLIVTFILIYYRLKYDIDHPKINYGR